MFAGIYYGGMYGGSTTSILLNTPGESASVVTAIEGFQMAKRGRGGAALATAAIGSFVAGTISTAGDHVPRAGHRRARALVPAGGLRRADGAGVRQHHRAARAARCCAGMLSLFLGLFVGLIGIDSLTGQARFTFGVPQLLNGLDVVVVAVGLFAVGEALYVASRLRHDKDGDRPGPRLAAA